MGFLVGHDGEKILHRGQGIPPYQSTPTTHHPDPRRNVECHQKNHTWADIIAEIHAHLQRISIYSHSIELIAQHNYLQIANSSLCPPELQSSPLQLPQYTPQQYPSAGFGVAPNGSYPTFYAAQHTARHCQQTGPPTGLPRTGAPSGSGIEILRDTAGKKELKAQTKGS